MERQKRQYHYRSDSDCARLWGELKGMCAKLAWKICKDDATVDEVLARALERLCEDRPVENIRAWLNRVVFLEACKRAARAKEVREYVDDEPGKEDAEDRVLREEIRVRVRRALLAMPKKWSKAAELYYLQDMQGRDAAQVAGMHYEAFRSNVDRARLYMREELRDVYNDRFQERG